MRDIPRNPVGRGFVLYELLKQNETLDTKRFQCYNVSRLSRASVLRAVFSRVRDRKQTNSINFSLKIA